jgi:8-oxo-dGTP pyrophosphatase MutT (NUDIX family)
MPAPAEFAQIIVIGLEAQVWLLLYALAFSSWRVPAEVPEGILLFVITAASLVLGVIVDRLADSAYTAVRDSSPARRVLKRLKVRVDDTPKWMITTMRSRTLESDDPRGRFLEYQRTRFRIARATTFNLVMLIPAVALFIGLRTELGVGALLDSVILIAIATGFTLSATERIGGAWVRALSEAYRQWAKQHPEQAGNDMDRTAGSLGTVDPRCFRVAAVCYRDGPHGPEFLVVKTSDGRFWTVPKGHVERGEAPWEAASREAKEEAGVVGEPSRTAFTAYRYPSGDGRCKEILVEAYLLPVERQSLPDPGERHRDQAWVDAGKAKSLLAAGRTLLHGLEHVRLIDEARKEIEGLSTV